MRIALLFLAASLAFAQPRAWVPSTSPQQWLGAAFNGTVNVDSYHVYFRISGPLATGTVWSNGFHRLRTAPDGIVFLGDAEYGMLPTPFVTGGVLDVRGVFVLNRTTDQRTLTLWKGDGTGRITQTSSFSDGGVQDWGGGRRMIFNAAYNYAADPVSDFTNYTVHFVRFCNGVPANTDLPPVDTVTSPCSTSTIAAYEFSDNLNDSGGSARHATLGGGGAAAYTNSSVPPSISVVAGPASVRVGEPYTLTSTAVCMGATDGLCVSKRWVITRSEAGQVRRTTGVTGETFTASASQHGSVFHKLIVYDGTVETASAEFEVGNYAADANGVAKVPTNFLNVLRLPPITDGSNPWPGASKTWEATANKIMSPGQIPTQVYGDACPGTVAIGGALGSYPARFIGTGTNFLECFGLFAVATNAIASNTTSIPLTAGHGTRFQYFLDNNPSGTVGYIHPPAVTFASLPAANSVASGTSYFVQDSSNCTSGGAAIADAKYCISNGTVWEVESGANTGVETITITNRATDTLTITRAASPRTFAAGAYISSFSQPVIRWNPPEQPAGSGRFTYGYDCVPYAGHPAECNATRMKTALYYYTYPEQSGLTINRMGLRDNVLWNAWINGSANWNYYDIAATIYQRYFASGRTSDLEWARAFADSLWYYPNDWGLGPGVGPKEQGVLGLTLRAIDGRSDTWGCVSEVASCGAQDYGLAYIAKRGSDQFNWPPGSFTEGTLVYEPRESGFATMYCALMALYHPNADVRDYFRTLVEIAIDYYGGNDPIRGPRQVWATGDLNYDGQISRYYDGTYGRMAQPFMHAWPMNGLLYAREAMLVVGDTTRAARALQIVERAATHVWDTREQARRGVYYSVGATLGSNIAGQLSYDTGLGFRASDSSGDNTQKTIYARALTNTLIGAFGWLYKITGNTDYRTRGCEWYAANYGGYPDDGYGGLLGRTGPCSPDSLFGEIHNALNSTPIAAKDSKDLAQGAGAARSVGGFPAAYVGEQASVTKVLHMGYLPASGATKVRYTVEYADRTTASPVICTAACNVSVEGNKGTWVTILVEHLDNADQPIAGRSGRGVWKI